MDLIINGLTLAYIGDAYYELRVRNYLVNKGITNVNKLHKTAVGFVSSEYQAKAILHLINNNLLSEKELIYFKTGRNKAPVRTGIDNNNYRLATGFESLIGYLSLNDSKRCDELIDIIINFLDKG